MLSDECDEGGGGRAVDAVGEVGDARGSSSGLAMRRPPSDWDRLKSSFIVRALAVDGRAAAAGAAAVMCERGSSDRRAETALQGGARCVLGVCVGAGGVGGGECRQGAVRCSAGRSSSARCLGVATRWVSSAPRRITTAPHTKSGRLPQSRYYSNTLHASSAILTASLCLR